MNRWSLREWTPILPWPTCPLAGQARFGQNMVVGSMRVLLALRGSVPRGVCLDPHFRYKCASPRLTGELPHNLLGEQRVAEVCILDQQRPTNEPVRTTVRFQEFRQHGQPLSPLVVTLPGEEIYVDAFVTLFESGAVKSGKAKSVYLFRRIFTEQMAPQVGFPLYRSEGSGDGIPQSYVRQDIDCTAQQRVWGHLWRLIEDAAYAETQRVRTTFGQAVYAKMQTGQCYMLTIQHNGGLLLQMRNP